MTPSRLALLFPGQGSQQIGMGSELAKAFPEAEAIFREADDILELPLSRIMWEGPETELTRTRIAQPAILVHSVAVFRVVRKILGPAAMAAGHSLGEFTAHVVAGTLSFEDALRAVRLRAQLMYRAGRVRAGTMAAVLGLTDDEVEAVCREVSLGTVGVVVPANFNSPGQVVISGDAAAVTEAGIRARELGARKAIPLSVSGAFHSPLMSPAEEGLAEHLSFVRFHDPRFPVYSNVTAGAVTGGAEARELLIRQLTAPVRWSSGIAAMVDEGVDRFVELGPGTVLAGLNRRNARGLETISIREPADLERLHQAGVVTSTAIDLAN